MFTQKTVENNFAKWVDDKMAEIDTMKKPLSAEEIKKLMKSAKKRWKQYVIDAKDAAEETR